MKNKEKYDLTEIDCIVGWQVNGCGRKIESTREITISHKGKTLKKERTQKGLVPYLMEWLEEISPN